MANSKIQQKVVVYHFRTLKHVS